MDFSGQHIPYNRELFAFLAGEQMGIPHGHGDVLMAHELLQFHECDLAGLCQPGCERMPHGMQCDHIQTVAVFWLQTEFSDGGFEARGSFSEGRLLAGLLEDGFRRFALIRLEHPDHVLRYSDENTLAAFLNDIKTAGVSIHVLSTQLENFRGPEAGSQGEQSHVMQLGMTLFKVVQKGLGFLSGQETNLSLLAFTIFQVPPLVDKGLTPLHMPVATARFMAERIKLKMLLTVCPASIFRVGALALGFLVAFLGFVFPVGVFKSCALRLESKFGVRSAIGKAWILALGWAQYWL